MFEERRTIFKVSIFFSIQRRSIVPQASILVYRRISHKKVSCFLEMALQVLNARLCGVTWQVDSESTLQPPYYGGFQNRCYKLMFSNMVGLCVFIWFFRCLTFFCYMVILITYITRTFLLTFFAYVIIFPMLIV